MLAAVRGKYGDGVVHLREPVPYGDGTEVLVVFLDGEAETAVLTADERDTLREILSERGYNLNGEQVSLLRMAQLGLDSKEMGKRLGIKPKLVRSRWSRIHKSLGTSTRMAAVRRAVEVGLIDPIKPLV